MISVFATQVFDYQQENLKKGVNEILAPFFMHKKLSDKSFLIKPNWLNWRFEEDPAAVNPKLLISVVDFLQEQGINKVAIMETPGIHSTSYIAKKMKITDELEKRGIKYGGFSRNCLLELNSPCVHKKINIFNDFQDFDYMINLAKVKTHSMMTFTLAVKNLFGMINGADRLTWHLTVGDDYNKFADLLLDIYLTVKPQINVLDGIVCMEGNGPGNGTPQIGNFLASSPDALALDYYVCKEILRNIDIPLFRQAIKRKLLPEIIMPDNQITPVDLLLPDVEKSKNKLGVGLPHWVQRPLNNFMVSYPTLKTPASCVGCGVCARVCPPQSLSMKNQKPHFNLKSCIRCFCCQEHCPQGAIISQKKFFYRIVNILEKIIRHFK